MREYEILGARARVMETSHLLERLHALRSGRALALDADVVCGREHLETAVEHALRAFKRGTNSANDIAMETMLFASGERQISRAREKMGLRPGSERVALVLFGADRSEVLQATGLEEDDSVLECTDLKLERYGIGRAEMGVAPAGSAKDLVLERVAFVEISKR